MSDEYWADPLNWDAEAAAGKVGRDGKHWLVIGGDMCDVFDPNGPALERARFWNLIKATPHLTWLLLTKRPQNFRFFLPNDWGEGYGNVWLGVTVDTRKFGYPRVDILRETPAKVKFLSCEPLLEDIGNIDLTGIDWAIVGGETGNWVRPFNIRWARNLKTRCAEFSVSFFCKQLGSHPQLDGSPFKIVQKQLNGKRDFNGKCPENFPTDLQVQEWPDVERATNLETVKEDCYDDMTLPEPAFCCNAATREAPLHMDELERVHSWVNRWRHIEESPLRYLAEVAGSAIVDLENHVIKLAEHGESAA